MSEARLQIPPAPFAAVAALERDLGCSNPVAQVLVRRGLEDPAAARAWLAGAERHPADAFGGMDEAVRSILGHVAAGSRIVVHGDYDVDGVCSTAILVRVLRELDADVGWYLPSRTEDGYGLSLATVDRLAAQGTGLLVTVDCGITAVGEVAAARAAGLDVVVTDHHTPRSDGALPDASIVHPRVGDYPCVDL
ncbi:MAG: single-stranded-DNA-specific exonuclease RecJ, partial [Solirubrobacteraceae bacterium]|nr:single-stranded-DNA-specific exonuclease RecJ [Solirubrobacteraceae bacterium]